MAVLVLMCAGCSTAFGLEEVPTLYIRWGPGPDLYDSLTVTVNVAVDETTPDGVYSIRSQQTTNPSNHSDHTFTITDGVASSGAFTIGNYGLFNPGVGPTGILLWVKDAPTNAYQGYTETYNYIDGGLEPSYHAHQNNAPVHYIDSMTFHLDAFESGEDIEDIQAVPEPATWIIGALAAAAAAAMAQRRRRQQSGRCRS
ncbi:MAG TPA: PEP-CTERM sorting domain-containing protein [Chthoniobacterales bacterium]|nr:PEP-CTERM sorting domain-containing protein [Chthoniobacterales bacterium]